MTRRLKIAAAVALLAAATPAPAFDLGFGLFKKKTPPKTDTAAAANATAKGDAAAQLKQLLGVLQSDPDATRRKAAAESLRSADPRTSPDLITTLVTSLQSDPSPAVRVLVADALGGYKSVYEPAALALESAEAADPDKAVRAAARTALWQYHVNGYKPALTSLPAQTPEPPLAKPSAVVSRPSAKPNEVQFRPTVQNPAKGTTTSASRPTANLPPINVPIPSAPPVGVPQRMPEKTSEPVKPIVVPPLPEPKPISTLPTREPGTLPVPLPSIPATPELPSGPPTPIAPPAKK